MEKVILSYIIEDFLLEKLDTDLFVKYYRDIYGFLIEDDALSEYDNSLFNELYNYLERYDENGIDEYYYLDKEKVKEKAKEIIVKINMYK